MFGGKGWHETGTDVLVKRRYRYGWGLSGINWELVLSILPKLSRRKHGFDSRMRHHDLWPFRGHLC